jgi:hypothetical protein
MVTGCWLLVATLDNRDWLIKMERDLLVKAYCENGFQDSSSIQRLGEIPVSINYS